MEPGIHISVIWSDADLIELRVAASNGVFAGRTDFYAEPDTPARIADALRGFPTDGDDARKFELGTVDAVYGGRARLQFFCTDMIGHAACEVELQAATDGEDGAREVVRLHVPVEAAAIDSFVGRLRRMTAAVGQAATLESAARHEL